MAVRGHHNKVNHNIEEEGWKGITKIKNKYQDKATIELTYIANENI